MEIIFFGIAFILFIGSILGVVSFAKVNTLQARLSELEKNIRAGQYKKTSPVDNAAQTDFVKPIDSPPPEFAPEPELKAGLHGEVPPDTFNSSTIDWTALLQKHWMVMLGSVCLVFSGVFLVRYSIEHGLLGPVARTVLGLLFGAILIAAGEKLRRSGRLEAGVHAAFVGSGALIIYSALLVGFHVYELISSQLTFLCLALMSAFTLLLALKHGPLMAGLGLLGAYLVPVLVSTGSQNIEAALLYSFIVSCSSLWFQRYIYRSWLWWGTWLGALSWLLISLELPEQAQGFRALYIAALAYIGVAFPFAGLKLKHVVTGDVLERDFFVQTTSIFAALTAASVAVLHIEVMDELSYPAIALLPLVAALVVRKNLPVLKLIPLISLLPIFFDLFSMDVSFVDWEITIAPLRVSLQASYLFMLGFIVLIFAMVGGNELFNVRHQGYWSSFILFIPLVAIILAYLRVSGMQGGLAWALPTLMIGALYGYLLSVWRNRKGALEVEAALAIASQFSISTACFFAFSEITLTLVLAAQLIGLVLLDRRIRIPVMPIIIKVLLIIVVVRLTINPWVALYEVSSLTLLLTYFGSLIACVIASRQLLDRPELRVWLHSASAHLLILTLAVSTRYVLYEGDIFTRAFNLAEASVYICSWAAIGIIYEWKSSQLASFQRWYRGMAMLHIYAAAMLFVFYNLLLHNPLWRLEDIGTTPVFNLLLIGYAIPVLLSSTVYKRIPGLRQFAGVIGVVGLYMFSTLEIRHLWNSGIWPNMPVQEGELYTYSLVWLLISVAMMIYGAIKKNTDVKKAGLIALLIVIAKAFLWDMRDLEGLWRVALFLGLGLSLLGIAYLFNKAKAAESGTSSRLSI